MHILTKALFAAAAAATLSAPAVSAAVVYDQTISYGNLAVADNAPVRFSDLFDFSGASYASIDSIELTLSYSGAGNGLCLGLLCMGEAWFVRPQGSNGNSSSDDLFLRISGTGTSSFTISAASDTGGANVFATSLANQSFAFWFAEQTTGKDAFTLHSATLRIHGEEAPVPTPIPLPAGMPLLAAGLGGLALLRRKG